MGKRRISVRINNSDELKPVLDYLKNYETEIEYRIHYATLELAGRGVHFAYSQAGNFGPLIQFYTEDHSSGNIISVFLIGKDARKIYSTWVTNTGIKVAEVSPILMAEFGSGPKARNPGGIPGVGQGTFPQHGDASHGFESHWSWMDTEGEWHSSRGIAPTQPMLKSRNELLIMCASVFSEVFDR